MKKLIFAVTNDLTYDQRMQKICRTLAKSGYEVWLVGRELPHSIPLHDEIYRQKRMRCLFHKGKLFYAEYNLRLFLYLIRQRFDAVCAIDLDTIAACALAARFKGRKLAFDAHEYFTEVPEVIRRPIVQRLWRLAEKIFVPMANVHYTVAPGLAEIFRKQTGKEFHVIYNVPEWREAPADSPACEKYLLYQGALNEGRGLESLLHAMPQIDIPLYLAGEGDLSDKLRKLAKRLHIEHKVKFLGRVPPGRLREITAGAYIGLHISEPLGLSYYYSLGNKFFDYIHASLPQICTAMPEYEKINREFEVALMIPRPAPEHIVDAVNRLMSDENYYQRLKKNCEVCARRYNWQAQEPKLRKIYDQLLG